MANRTKRPPKMYTGGPTAPTALDYPACLSLYERESRAAEAILAAQRKKKPKPTIKSK